MINKRIRTAYLWGFIANQGTAYGSLFLLTALPMVQSSSYTEMGTQAWVQAAPTFVLGLVFAAVRRRGRFRSLVIPAMAVQMTASMVFGIASLSADGRNAWLALAVGFTSGIAIGSQLPGRQSLIADLFEPAERKAALSRLSVKVNIARLASPALAGLTIGLDLWSVWFLLDAMAVGCLMALTAVLMRAAKAADSQAPAAERPARKVFQKPDTAHLQLLVPFAVLCVFGYNIQLLAPTLAADNADIGSNGVGFLITVHSLGGLIGSAVCAKLHHRLPTIFGASAAVLGLGTVLLAPFNIWWVIWSVLFVAGIGRGASITASNVLANTASDDAPTRERLMANYTLIFGGSNLISAPMVVALISYTGFGGTYLVLGIGTLVGAAIWIASQRSRKWDQEPSNV